MSSLSQGQTGHVTKPRENTLFSCTGQVLSAVDLRWDHGQEPEPKCPPARISFQSKPKPLNLGQCRSKSAAAELAEPHAHILLIDDNSANQQILEKKLTESGHRVTVASSYSEAQRLAQTTPPAACQPHTSFDRSAELVHMPTKADTIPAPSPRRTIYSLCRPALN